MSSLFPFLLLSISFYHCCCCELLPPWLLLMVELLLFLWYCLSRKRQGREEISEEAGSWKTLVMRAEELRPVAWLGFGLKVKGRLNADSLISHITYLPMGNSTFQDQNGKSLKNQLTSSRNSRRCDINMPTDVVFHILLCLPVVSLLKFKSVCQSWCSLIKSSEFVNQHLNHHQEDNGSINLIFLSPSVYHQVFEDLSHPSSNVSCACLLSAEKFEVLDLPYRDCWVYGNLSIVASCNGLICLQHEDDGNVYLWNPARKQFRGLLDEPKGNCPRGEFFSLGFGFDANTNDYKVVRYRKDLNSEVQVYNLNTDSWRSIDVAVPLLTEIISSLKAPYQNVIYCWLGSVDHITDSVMIISFDFSSEKFGTIPLPSNIKNSSDSLEISIIKGSIACIQRDSYCGTDSWHGEIWILSGYGFEESWNKLYRFGPFPRGWYWLMAFLKKEEFVLLLKEGQLCLYNLSTRDTEYLPVQVQVQGSEQLGPSFDVVLYKESLVSIKKGSGSACCN